MAVLIVLVSVSFQAVMDVLGPDIHTKNVGAIHLVQFDSEGVFGWIPTQRELVNQFLSGDEIRHVILIPFFFKLLINTLALYIQHNITVECN